MATTVEQIKSRLNVVDVVGSYLKLEKAGSNLKARCPFHNEKTASFYVSPARESFHCFGCNKGGDIFEFVKEIEGVEFIDALKILAERAGVKIEREDAGARSEKGRLISALENAVLFYQKELKRNPQALEYLKKRGLTEETIAAWKIGFAPDSWRSVYDHLKSLRFTDQEIEKTGLTIKSPKGYYDRFRNRIMFPIANVSGLTVGFSGRIMPSSADKEAAKYINSPQTDLFDKSKVMFGFDKARVAMRTSDTCILVEGQMDLLMSHQAGIANTVAVSGTALTDEHIRNIKRLANRLVLAFDGDAAGFKAAHRGTDMALAAGMDVRAAKLPLGVDPADLILEDKTRWSQAVDEAKHIIDFYLEVLEARGYEPRLFKIEVEKLVLPYVARIKSSIEQAHFVNLIARKLGIDEAPIWQALRTLSVDATAQPQTADSQPISASEYSRSETLLKKIIGLIFWQRAVTPESKELDEIETELKRVAGEGRYHLLQQILQDKRDSLIFEAEISFAGGHDTQEYLREMVADLHQQELKDNLNNTRFKLKRAEASVDQVEIEEQLKEAARVSQELANVKHNK